MIMSDGRANPNLYSNNRFYDKYTGDNYGYVAQNLTGTAQTRMIDEICTNKNEPQLSPDAPANIQSDVEQQNNTSTTQEAFGSQRRIIRNYTTEPARQIKLPKVFCNDRSIESEDLSFMNKVKDYLTGAGKSEGEKSTVEHFCTEHWESVASSIMIVIVILFIAISVIAILGLFSIVNAVCGNEYCSECGKCCLFVCPKCGCCGKCCKCESSKTGLSGGGGGCNCGDGKCGSDDPEKKDYRNIYGGGGDDDKECPNCPPKSSFSSNRLYGEIF